MTLKVGFVSLLHQFQPSVQNVPKKLRLSGYKCRRHGHKKKGDEEGVYDIKSDLTSNLHFSFI